MNPFSESDLLEFQISKTNFIYNAFNLIDNLVNIDKTTFRMNNAWSPYFYKTKTFDKSSEIIIFFDVNTK